MTAILKAAWEIDLMREAGRIVAECHDLIAKMVRPGVTTADLDAAVEKHIVSRGAWPTFKGYRGYPASICASVNEEVVHGIPSPKRVLREGDIVGVDIGATWKNYVGDAAATYAVGAVDAKAGRLLDVTREALTRAIAAAQAGRPLLDIGRAVQAYVEAQGYSVVKKYVGHGIGQRMHEEPNVPNYVPEDAAHFDLTMKPGLVVAIEPMVNEGGDDVRTLKDRWTVVTCDGSRSAHFEHTVAVTKDGPKVLTVV